jgi:hypothetical protein
LAFPSPFVFRSFFSSKKVPSARVSDISIFARVVVGFYRFSLSFISLSFSRASSPISFAFFCVFVGGFAAYTPSRSQPVAVSFRIFSRKNRTTQTMEDRWDEWISESETPDSRPVINSTLLLPGRSLCQIGKQCIETAARVGSWSRKLYLADLFRVLFSVSYALCV